MKKNKKGTSKKWSIKAKMSVNIEFDLKSL